MEFDRDKFKMIDQTELKGCEFSVVRARPDPAQPIN